MVESLAERQWYHHWLSAHYVPGLFDCRQPVPPAAPGPGCLERPRRLLVLVRCCRASRHARRRRVPAPPSDPGELPSVHGNGGCEPAGSSPWSSRIAGPDPAAGAVSRCLQRRHVEPRGDFSAREYIQHRPGRLRCPQGLPESRVVGPGRLARLREPDAESRPSCERAFNAFANDVALPPFQEAGRPDELDNFQPRVGFAWKLGERTVIRGGTGLYYGDALGADQSFATGNAQIVVIQYANDGRADFAANPTNGQPLPTYDQALRRFCYNNGNLPGCLIRDLQEFVGPVEFVNLPRTFQTSIGFQRQLGNTMSFEADYVYTQGRDEKDVVENINLSYNPATGANYPSSNRALRPYPDWGVVSMNTHLARSGYHALQTGFQNRFANHWQGSATYTLSGLWNADTPPFSGLEPVPFPTVPDLGGEWGLSSDDQRHRAVFSGIWEVGRGFQVSALHFFAGGLRLASSWGSDLRQTGAANSQRLRPDGSIIPRNSLIAPAQNRTDLRVQQRIRLGGRVSIDGIAEVFNMFNNYNYGIGTVESNLTQYLQPISAQTRTAQIGFRLQF